MEIDIRHDEANHRFEAVVDGETAVLRYAPRPPTTVDFQSTYVPPELRRRGVGSALVRAGLDDAAKRGLRVIPTCWFVAEFIDEHPEYGSLRVEG